MLFDNIRHTRKKSHLHYGTARKARQTLRYLKKRPLGEQRCSVQSMYHRAKYHARQTEGMREAMKIYSKFLDKTAIQ